MSEEPEPGDFDGVLRRRFRANPFVPFEIVRNNGDRYEVTNPWHFAMGGDTVVVLRPGGSQFFRKSQIVAVRVHETA